ncbi:NlpC/P60 family protein [Anaerovorax odorimutans]|uniref:NlpC/P60 family protein n=1 Tax=Anaerovorax odorimutans TaxID=109327 RepID=A0ABT1RK83_9FIRM|nr:NlpC/P60 family protein [Anaerovorax odorimutans]MCQ4635583.1 NlpC/P60 family protein [Anaerovorax odorimutans]
MRTTITEDRKKMLKIAVAGLALVVLILGVCSFLQMTKPYAVSDDGSRIQEPWAVKIGDKEAFVVASQKEGQAVIDGIKEKYSTANTKAGATSLSPAMSVEKKDLKRSGKTINVTAADDAVEQIVTAAAAGQPLVSVTTVDQVSRTEKIAYQTEYRIDNKLDKDEKKIITQGQEGGKLITSQVVRVNGNVMSEEVVSEKVTRQPVAMVVAKGDDTVKDDAVLTAAKAKETEKPTSEAQTEPATEPTSAEKQDKPEEQQTVPVVAAAEKEPSKATQPSTAAVPSTESTKPTKATTEKPTTKPTTEKPTTKPTTEKPTTKPTKEPSKPTKPPASSNKGQAVVDYALQFVGNPYVYGGSSLTHGTDCSGFTMSVYAKFGISLPHSSSAQRSCGRGVSYSQAKPGDIICYSGHVALYMGGGKIVHASNPTDGIKISSATYRDILTVRRIIE